VIQDLLEMLYLYKCTGTDIAGVTGTVSEKKPHRLQTFSPAGSDPQSPR
jgi:hypothetical protein